MRDHAAALRSLLGGLGALTLAGLSCAVPDTSDTAPAPPPDLALPAVSAPPPGFASQTPVPVPKLVAEREPTAGDPEVALALEFLSGRRTGLAAFEEERLAHAIVREAERNGLDTSLVLAVIAVESAGNAFAVSRVGALGLMQVMPATGEELAGKLGLVWRGPHELFDPFVNVQLGTAYLRELAKRYGGSLDAALAAYNWGPGRIDRRIRRGTPLPVRYARLVLDLYGDREDENREDEI